MIMWYTETKKVLTYVCICQIVRLAASLAFQNLTDEQTVCTDS